MSVIHPWHVPVFNHLAARRQHMPHAILLQGRRGIGKVDFAQYLARALLCEVPGPGGESCGTCSACLWFDAGNHPDFRWVTLETEASEASEQASESSDKKDATQITVDQIRDLSTFMTTSTHRHGFRVVLVEPADALNLNAANALLKSLEEPSPGTVCLLVSSHPQRLLATVRSRCQVVKLPMPTSAAARSWLVEQGVKEPDLPLALAAGAPFDALRWASPEHSERVSFLQLLTRQDSSLFALTEPVARVPITDLVEWLQRWCYDLLEMKLLGQVRFNQDFAGEQQRVASRVALFDLLAWEHQLREARRVASHPLNARLFAESLLAPYMAMR